MQIVLLTVGGILILYGFLRGTSLGGLTGGYIALNDRDYSKAATQFETDLKSNPGRVPSRLGLVIALLGTDRGSDAEAEWAKLMEIPDPVRNPGVRALDAWQQSDPRGRLRHEGDLIWAQTWLAANRVAQGFRLNQPRSTLAQYDTEYRRLIEQFRGFVVRRESVAGRDSKDEKPDSDGLAAGVWTSRYQAVRAFYDSVKRASGVQQATQLMTSQERTVRGEKTEVLRAMAEHHLNRAKQDSPKDIEIHAWWLLVVGELARRKETMVPGWVASGEKVADGDRVHAMQLLEADIRATLTSRPLQRNGDPALDSLGPYDRDSLEADPVVSVRFAFSLALAELVLRESVKSQPGEAEALTTHAVEATATARRILGGISSTHPEREELDFLAALVAEEARLKYSEDGGR